MEYTITEKKLEEIRNELYNKANLNNKDYYKTLLNKEWIVLDEGVYEKKCNDDDIVNKKFYLVFEENTILENHNHLDNIEEIFVISGTLTEMINNKILKQGNVYKLPKNKKYKLYSEKGCKCKVTINS
jgi:hypothetical protein